MIKSTTLRNSARKRKKLHVQARALKEHSFEILSEKLIIKLNAAEAELAATKAELRDVTCGLEEIMFQTTHKVRQPIAELSGLSNLLDQSKQSQSELKKITGYLKYSISTLDTFTRDLIKFISNLLGIKK